MSYLNADGRNRIFWRMLGKMGMSGPKRANKPKRARSNNCVHFDGTDDTIAISDYDISASGTGDFSLSFWFKTDSTTDITNTPFLFKEQTRGATYLQFYINPSDKVSFTAKVGGTFVLTYSSEAQSNDLAGGWNHIVYTCDRDAGQAVYINGAALTEEADTIADTTTSINNTSGVALGKAGSYFLDGKISEYASFSKALSATEVAFLHRKKGKYDLSRSKLGGDLTCWLQMGDGTEGASGVTVYDMSANSNNGTLTDGPAFAADGP
jgi:hypothetical protein